MPRTLAPRTLRPRAWRARALGGPGAAGGGGGGGAAPWGCGAFEGEWEEAAGELVEGLGRPVTLVAVRPDWSASAYSAALGRRADAATISADMCAVREVVEDGAVAAPSGGAAIGPGTEQTVFRVRATLVEQMGAGAPREGWYVIDRRGTASRYEVVAARRECEGRIYALVCRQGRRGQPSSG